MSQESPNPPSADPTGPAPPSGSSSPGESGDKKGLSALQWVLIVLGGLFVLMAGSCVACGVVFNRAAQQIGADFQENPTKAAAEMVVRLNPGLEIVSSDDEAGTMTIRNRETDEEVTVDFSEVAEGDLTWSTEEGSVSMRSDEGGVTATGPEGERMRIGAVDLDDVPEWVLLYPDGELQEGGMTGTGGERVGGTLQLITADGIEEVADFYETRLRESGHTVNVQSSRGDAGMSTAVVTGETSEPERRLTAMIAREDDRTTITLQYSGSSR